MRSVVVRNVVMRRMTVHIGDEYAEQDG
jgi:hypothetical protein